MNKLIELLPPYERESEVFKEIMNAEQVMLDKLNIDIADLEKQLNIDTATWGFIIYEKELGIKTNLNKPLEERRSVIKSKWRGTGKVDRALIKAVVDAYTNGGVDVEFNGKIIVTFNDVKGIPPNIEDVYKAIENIKPAHLAIIYIFVYLTWNEFDNYNKTWNEWDSLNLTWDEFEVYKEAI